MINRFAEPLSKWRDCARPTVYAVRFSCLPLLVAATALRIAGSEAPPRLLEGGVVVLALPVRLFLTCDHIQQAWNPKSKWKAVDKASKSVGDVYKIVDMAAGIYAVDLGLRGRLLWWAAKGQRLLGITPIKLGIALYQLAFVSDRMRLEEGYDVLAVFYSTWTLFYSAAKLRKVFSPETIVKFHLIRLVLLTVRAGWKMKLRQITHP